MTKRFSLKRFNLSRYENTFYSAVCHPTSRSSNPFCFLQYLYKEIGSSMASPALPLTPCWAKPQHFPIIVKGAGRASQALGTDTFVMGATLVYSVELTYAPPVQYMASNSSSSLLKRDLHESPTAVICVLRARKASETSLPCPTPPHPSPQRKIPPSLAPVVPRTRVDTAMPPSPSPLQAAAVFAHRSLPSALTPTNSPFSIFAISRRGRATPFPPPFFYLHHIHFFLMSTQFFVCFFCLIRSIPFACVDTCFLLIKHFCFVFVLLGWGYSFCVFLCVFVFPF